MSHQHHGQILVNTAHPAAVDLDKLQGRRLEELLKHHPVVTLNRKRAPSGTSLQRHIETNFNIICVRSIKKIEIPALLLRLRCRVEPKPEKDTGND